MDLRGARQQRLVGQQLSKDAAHSPAEQRTHRAEEAHPLTTPPCHGFAAPLPTPPRPGQTQSPPALLLPHVDAGGLGCHPQQQLGCSVPVQGTALSQGDSGRASTKEAPTALRGLTRITLSQRSSAPGAGHSPERDNFGGHRLWRHPIGACQSKISCNRDSRSRERQASRSNCVTERRESCGHIYGRSQIGSCQGLTYLHTAFISHEQVGHLQIPVRKQSGWSALSFRHFPHSHASPGLAGSYKAPGLSHHKKKQISSFSGLLAPAVLPHRATDLPTATPHHAPCSQDTGVEGEESHHSSRISQLPPVSSFSPHPLPTPCPRVHPTAPTCG